MWPNSPFAVPVGSFVSPVPVPGVDPLSGDCCIIRINKDWIPYIQGALAQLTLQSTWDTDEAGLAIVQQQANNLIFAFNTLEPGGCNTPDPGIDGISEGDDMGCCLRYQDGKLQMFCCGEWTDVPGQEGPAGPAGPSQPGAGNKPPAPAGGTGNYCFGIEGPGSRILPVTVNSGDTLLFNNLDGAWNDKREIIWNCSDGWIFTLGACGQTFAHGAPDPLPTALHMQLIVKINGNYYDALNLNGNGEPQPWTVPGGIANADVLIMPNIDDDSQVQGGITFCVTVTNNQPVTGLWTHVFDFLANDGGFAPIIDVTRTPQGNGRWITNAGWEGTVSTDGTDTDDAVNVGIILSAPVVINTMVMTYDLAKGTLLTGVHNFIGCNLGGSGGNTNIIASDTDTDGIGKTLAITPGAYTVDQFFFKVIDAFFNSGAVGSVAVTQLVITGEGVDPF